ncbi:MAG: response regulator [Thermoproteota archaeon]|nr:response regulator [Thermoproteota archaeon]
MEVLSFNRIDYDKDAYNYVRSRPDNLTNDNLTNDNDQIKFINYTQQYCIGIIDIVNSTNETSKISSPPKLRKYYSLFLNTMSSVINNCNGKVIKNIGDSLFFYFPKTCDETNEPAFHEVFECGMRMLSASNILDSQLCENDLQPINYRICMDYGEVEIAMSDNSNEVDLFGSVVNECSKMNNFVSSKELWIGEKLYYRASKSQFINNYAINKVNLQNNGFDNIKSSKNFDYLYSVSILDEIQRNKTILDYRETQNTIKKNNLSKPVDNATINILVIDDEEDILYTFDALLNRQGYKVKAFSNSIEAFTHFTEKSPYFYDLILMDIRMPGINGIQLYRKLRAINPYAKILLISALDVVHELIESIPGINMKEIIRKPIEPEDFILKIKSIIND